MVWIIAASFCRALPSLAPPLANCKASCVVNNILQSDVMPTATAPARVPKIPPKSTSAIATTSNTLLVSVASAATPPDRASSKMEEDSTARAHKKQRRSDMRSVQHTDATQQPSSMIIRRVPDKTHTRQPVPALWRAHGSKWTPSSRPPPSRDDGAHPCVRHAARSRPAVPPTSVGQQTGPIPRFAGVARRRKRR